MMERVDSHSLHLLRSQIARLCDDFHLLNNDAPIVETPHCLYNMQSSHTNHRIHTHQKHHTGQPWTTPAS
jgi:hypothetical protein